MQIRYWKVKTKVNETRKFNYQTVTVQHVEGNASIRIQRVGGRTKDDMRKLRSKLKAHFIS